MVKVDYFYDPMCGWCFGASKLIHALQQAQYLELKMHPGGMIKRRSMDPVFRQMVIEHDSQIERITGQKFGDSYKDRVTGKTEIILDSYLTAQAIDAAQAISGRGLEMLSVVQTAHFQDGLDVSDVEVLGSLVESLGLDTHQWQSKMQTSESHINAVIESSRFDMNQMQLKGFPSLVLQTDSGPQRIDHTRFYSKPKEWQNYLDTLIV